MKRKIVLGITSLVVALLAIGAFSWMSQLSNKTEKEEGKIEVVATFYPIYEFTKNIVGDEGNVELLIGAGTEVHDFEPSTKDIAKIQDADAFVYDDDSMETWVPNVTEAIDTESVSVIKATGDMLLAPGTEEGDHDHDHGEEGHTHEYDPHVWLAPNLAITLVENIRDQLSESYPEKAEAFAKNAAAYIEKLEALDKEYSDALSDAKQTSFVTQHSAFGYLALEYGLNQVAITGVSSESDLSAKRLAELAEYVKEYDIQYIYFEENANASISEALAKETGVKTAVLNPLESLTKEQMENGEDYFSVMRSNLENLRLTTDKEGKEIEAEEDTSKTVSKGYFETEDVTDRTLSDWTGEWQSVYPYLVDGSLDEVWEYKAKTSDSMTAEEYKEYYTVGYKTDVEKITIDGKNNKVTFVRNGESQTFTYKYVGYEILQYEKGNRGVRYLFETEDKDAGEFKYIQFSDHGIEPADSEHFHLFWGDSSQEEILKEMDNWPTYYPDGLTGREIAQEIIAH